MFDCFFEMAKIYALNLGDFYETFEDNIDLESSRNWNVPGERCTPHGCRGWMYNNLAIFLFYVFDHSDLLEIVAGSHGRAESRIACLDVVDIDLRLLVFGVYSDICLVIDICHTR